MSLAQGDRLANGSDRAERNPTYGNEIYDRGRVAGLCAERGAVNSCVMTCGYSGKK